MTPKPLRMSANQIACDKKDFTSATSNLKGSEKETPTIPIGLVPPLIPIGRVYLITNLVNDKRYVGITTRSLKQRWYEHVSNKLSYVSVLRKAISKYGKENFSIQLLEELLDTTEKELQLRESFYIDKCNTFIDGGQGYNLVKQSDAKLIFSESLKKKMSEKNSGEGNPFYGKHHNEESKKKIGGAVVDYSGSKNPFFGKTHTEEARRKSSEWNKKYQSGENHPRLGKTFTEASRAKMSLAQKGKRTGADNSFYGKHHTEKSKKLLSIAHKGIYDGGKNPFADRTIRRFKNTETNEEFVGIQSEFRIKYNFKPSSLCGLCKGRLKTLKGWMLA